MPVEWSSNTKGAPINHRCVIFDIDGTLANNDHRKHHIQKIPKDWPAFNSEMHLDSPIELVVTLAKILRQHYAIILCTGRDETCRDVTQEWLRLHDVWHDGLWMRAAQDFRSDDIVKREMLADIRSAGFDPQMVVDDRVSVVAMWRAEGLLCLQCAPGEF